VTGRPFVFGYEMVALAVFVKAKCEIWYVRQIQELLNLDFARET